MRFSRVTSADAGALARIHFGFLGESVVGCILTGILDSLSALRCFTPGVGDDGVGLDVLLVVSGTGAGLGLLSDKLVFYRELMLRAQLSQVENLASVTKVVVVLCPLPSFFAVYCRVTSYYSARLHKVVTKETNPIFCLLNSRPVSGINWRVYAI